MSHKPPTFIATGTATDNQQYVVNNGFYPDIDIADFRARYRLDDGTIPEDRVIQALETSLLTTHQDLNKWACLQVRKGHQHLIAIPADHLGEQQDLNQLYKTAIYSRAKASLIEQYPDYDTTSSGLDRATALRKSIAHYQAEHFAAIRALQRKPRCIIEAL